MPGARVSLARATEIVPGEWVSLQGFRTEVGGAGRVPPHSGHLFWRRRPLPCPQEPRDSRGWRGLPGKPCQQPPARQEHLPIRGFRDQLCLSAILKSSDIFQRQGGRE